MSVNPHYKHLFGKIKTYAEKAEENRKSEHLMEMKAQEERRERKEKIQKSILLHIPEHPKFLYPLARRIKRFFILHIGPTNSGKTHEAMQALAEADSGVYLAPLRLLAFEGYDKLNSMGVPCDMITGEEIKRVEGAKHVSSTIEILNTTTRYDVAVIDEAQMIADENRGGGWTAAILGVAANRIHVCLAPEAESIIVRLIEDCGDAYEIVHHERECSLELDESIVEKSKDVRPGDALIVFSRNKVLQCAGLLQADGIKCSVLYGSLPYEVRYNEVRRFAEGKTSVVVTTDCIGMGMNLPIRRVVFLEQEKFDGTQRRRLTASEFRQIAGRAGRKGFYDKGFYSCMDRKALLQKSMQKDPDQIRKARLGFEKALLAIDKPLSETMTVWSDMPLDEEFAKNDISEQIELCRELERYTDDKNLIYRFITIPFDKENVELKQIWYQMFHAERKGEHVKYNDSICGDSIESLEQSYKVCDLYFYYVSRFDPDEDLQIIIEKKATITRKLAKILSERRIKQKVCSICGRPLPWMYTFNQCESCFLAW